MESTFQHFGRLDILVNAAAGNFLVPAEDLSPNGFRTGGMLYHPSLHYMYVTDGNIIICGDSLQDYLMVVSIKILLVFFADEAIFYGNR